MRGPKVWPVFTPEQGEVLRGLARREHSDTSTLHEIVGPYSEHWSPDYAARQVTDDIYRATGDTDIHRYQGVLERYLEISGLSWIS